ncbi:MAG: MBL fold metallo-hydrolase [Pseudoflavonifractor sp.]|nr:MBL fold metallo-hydrolase [Pseudoflavonifractor sp.]
MVFGDIVSHINTLFNSITYRIGNILIDPGDTWDGFDGADTILLTHGHFDHIYGLNDAVKYNPKMKIYTNTHGAKMLSNARLNMSLYHGTPFILERTENIIILESDCKLNLSDDLTVEIFFTPGHNPSCITYGIGYSIFTGDAYIPGIKTVTNLPGGDKISAKNSVDKILDISIGKNIYPGHQI